MKQTQKSEKLFGAGGFERYYADLFGERWASLNAALQTEPDYVQWNAGGTDSYFLDAASVRAALTLPLQHAKNILDMCAAPGGKTLVLASVMDADAMLLSNERSSERKNRLAKVCDTCLPQQIRERVTVSCKDGAKMCLHQPANFDAILLDAPCSSERHVLADKKYLSEWSPSRIKTLAMTQWALLSSAWRMLLPEGFLLYATCALSPAENDEIISRLLKKYPDVTACEPVIHAVDFWHYLGERKNLPECERTAFGAHILPDNADGAGPLYFSLLKKSANS